MTRRNAIYIPKRIYNRLKSIYSSKLTVICAPENYGKTTLLHEFIRRSRPKGSTCRFMQPCESASECFRNYCELVIGTSERLPITEVEYCTLLDKFRHAQPQNDTMIVVMDFPAASEMLLHNLYCFRLISEHSPALTVTTRESITLHCRSLLERHSTNLIDKHELLLTADETEEYLSLRGITNVSAKLIHKGTEGEMLRTRLCAEIIANGGKPVDFSLDGLLKDSIIKRLPRGARFAALCACAFNTIDKETCKDLNSEPALVEFFGTDILKLSSIYDGLNLINRMLPNFWINTYKKTYTTPLFIRMAASNDFNLLDSEVKNAFLRCCARDYLRMGKTFTALCQYCKAGEYQLAAALPMQRVITFNYILTHKPSIYEIVTTVPLDCKPMMIKLIQMLALLMLTDYRERAKPRLREVIEYISNSPDYTPAERRNMLCYAYALSMYQDFYVIQKMGIHIKRAYELYTGKQTFEFDPPFYSYTLYTPSVFAMLYRYSISTTTQFEQFTRYHRMYSEIVHHGEYIEAVYIGEMYYYKGNFEKSLAQSLAVAKRCTQLRFIPTQLVALKTAAKCAMLTGHEQQYYKTLNEIADIARRFSSTEIGDMALLTMAMIACLRGGRDEDAWSVISTHDEDIRNNRYTAPFYYYVRCCFMLVHEEYKMLIKRSEEYIQTAADVQNDTLGILMKLTVATALYLQGHIGKSLETLEEILDFTGKSEMIMPLVEHCISFPYIFRCAAEKLSGDHAAAAQRILSAAAPCIEKMEMMRTQELTDISRAQVRPLRIAITNRRARQIHRAAKIKLSEDALKYAILASEGSSNAEIAQLFGTTEDSVKSSLKRTYIKLGISSRPELPAAIAALENGKNSEV